MKTLCLHYFIIDVAYLTLLAPYIYKGKKVCVFFQTHGEINLEIDTDYRNKYDIFTSLVLFVKYSSFLLFRAHGMIVLLFV